MSSPATCSIFTDRQNQIHPRIVEKLKAWIKSPEAENLGTPSHKFFQHATDLPSRESTTYPGVVLKGIEAAHKTIVSAERAVINDLYSLALRATLSRSSR
jgi:hypothetical protein